MPKTVSSGPAMMFASSVLFSIMAILVKLISDAVPAPEIIFFRSFISVIFILGMVFIGKVRLTFRSKEKLVFRGIIGGISLMLYFYGITLTSLSNAILLGYTYPIFASIFSSMYLKEELTKEKVAFIIAAFTGLLLILQFDLTSFNLGDILALVSGITSGMAIVSIRELRRTDSSAVIVFSFVLSGSIFSLFFMKNNFIIPSTESLSILLVIGVFGAIGQLFMTSAYKICSTALGGVISMSAVIMTAVLSFFIFGDKLAPQALLGGLLIFVSATFFSLKERYDIAK